MVTFIITQSEEITMTAGCLFGLIGQAIHMLVLVVAIPIFIIVMIVKCFSKNDK